MKLNKKVVEGMVLAASLLTMTTVAGFGGSTQDNTGDVNRGVALGKNGTAGIIFELRELESDIIDESEMMFASIEKTQTNVVSESGEDVSDNSDAGLSSGVAGLEELAAETIATESTEAQSELKDTVKPQSEDNAEIVTEEVAQTPEEAEWSNRVMADVEEDMNIRTEPSAQAELAGKFYRGDVAEIVSVEGDWTQIASGNVTGYVKNEYLVYGMEANKLANEVCSLYATVNADALRLRSEPSEEADVVKTAANGDKLKVDKEAEFVDGWVAVQESGTTAYVSADYVEVALNLGTALTAEEVAKKEAEEAGITKKPALSAGADEVTLLGALIQCEAGGGSYEGMLAVGSVVMNRVRSGGYPNSISGVIYQSGQFPPALNGSVANVMARGVNCSCLQAAQEAISGVDNTNGAVAFRSAASGYQGTVIGANVFF